MNGQELADAALELHPQLKVLFITGYSESFVVKNGHLNPGMHVLSKPFTIEELGGRIKEVLTSN